VLIDAGGSVGLATYLRQLRVDMIDLVVASHNHSDHIGGMTTVLGKAVVRFYMDNGIAHTTATYRNTMQAVQARGANTFRGRTAPSPSARQSCMFCRRALQRIRTTAPSVCSSSRLLPQRCSPAIRNERSSRPGSARERSGASTCLHEGSVLRVRFGLANQPDWSSAVIDKEEEQRRRKEAQRILDELKRNDLGGDIQL